MVTRPALVALLIAACSLHAEDKWVRLKSGPFEVLSNAGERPARERLYEAEQMRHVLGELIGKKDLTTVWPIRILVLKDKRAAAPGGIAMGRDSWISAANSDEWKRACIRILLEDNTRRLPAEIDRGLIALLSTLDVKGTKLMLGTPPGDRTRDWARVWLMATTPEYRGRMRVFVSNVEQSGEYEPAYRNAFEKKSAEINKQVDAALAAGNFEPVQVSARALSEKDFTVREAPAHDGSIALADLAAADPARAAEAAKLYQAAGGVEADEGLKKYAEATKAESKNPRAWLAMGNRAAYLQAAELNPKWAEPYLKLAALETDPGRKATMLQKAAEREPRNAATWKAFALALVDARQFVMAAKAWTNAEHAAETPEERASMHQARLDIESARADYEADERKSRMEAAAKDLQRVKDNALREIREAEGKANDKMRADHGDKPEDVVRMEDLDKPNRVEGKLTKVDCLANNQARLSVTKADGKVAQFYIDNGGSLVVSGAGGKAFACGIQKSVRSIIIEYRTTRDVQSISFP